MNRSLRWAARTARILAGHVGRLHDTLEILREAVARAVGQSAAGAAQDAVQSLLTESPTESIPPADPYYPRPSSAGWYDPDRRSPSWDDDSDDPYRRRQDDAYEERPDGGDSPSPSPSGGRRWGLALAVGCQATAWWLRREADRFTTLKALGIGVASTLAAYVAGPVLWAGAGLAGSALALAALSDAARSGAAALFGFGRR